MSDEASRAQAAEAARTNYQAQRDAMVAGDADALGALLADGFTLTHMTRYLQPKVEWLADVRSGEMTYDAIQDVDVTVDVDADTGTPVLIARTRTEATIWGSHGTWPLRLRIRFSGTGGSWLASDTVASTWS
jgi:hypothetical protein